MGDEVRYPVYKGVAVEMGLTGVCRLATRTRSSIQISVVLWEARSSKIRIRYAPRSPGPSWTVFLGTVADFGTQKKQVSSERDVKQHEGSETDVQVRLTIPLFLSLKFSYRASVGNRSVQE